MKKLRRSTKNQVLSGVLGGFGEYFNVDPVLLRVAFIFFLLITGIFPGVVAYVLAILLMPKDTDPVVHEAPSQGNTSEQT